MSVSSLTVRTKQKFKVILLGDQAVGKTCLIQQFVNGRFQCQQTVLHFLTKPTVGIDFVVTNIQHNGKQYRLQLWDTAGQQRFKSLIPSYLKDSQCAIILYDLTNKTSFHNINKWFDLYRENVDQNAFAVIVGNKQDLKNKFQGSEEAHQSCTKKGLEHFQVSAKTGKNVNQLFKRIVDLIQEKCNKPFLDHKILQMDDHQKLNNVQINNSLKLRTPPKNDIVNEYESTKRCC